jgi:peptide/nickel transport system substrate-binding protein
VSALVRNPFFSQWSSVAQPAGLPDVIRWVPEKTHAQGLRDVEAGRADLIYPAAEEIASLAKNYPARLKLLPAAFTQFVVLNATVAPFNKHGARQAVAYALNRDRAIAALFYGSVACRLVPPNYPGYTAGCAYPRDLAIAKALVTESGTRGAQVHVYFSSHQPFAQIGRHVAGVLNEIGYHATLTLEDPYHYQVHDARRPVNIEGFAWAPDFPSISQFYYPMVSCQPGSLLPMACDPRLDKLAAHATQTQQTDPGVKIGHGVGSTN